MAGGKKGGGSSKGTQADDGPKSKEKSKDAKSAPGRGGGDQKTDDHGAKKPEQNVRTLIGGASWTGKLPVTLFSEHCRKQKWDQPEYSMHRTAQGFSSQVTLRATNPKTKEQTVLTQFITLPPSLRHLAVQPTAVEARHFAAAFALFRVCSMKNVHLMLPPQYKSLWKDDFQKLKNEDVTQGNAYLYEPDPFATKLERDGAKALSVERRRNTEAKNKKEAEVTLGTGLSVGGSREWSNLPAVDMGERMRLKIEEMVRKKTIWNSRQISIPVGRKGNTIRELITLGFRESHIKEALDECGSREEALEWLLVYVPEDDLPPWSLPQTYSTNIKIASGNIQRDAAIQRLASAGYNSDLCARIFDSSEDESQAATVLQNILLYGYEPDHTSDNPGGASSQPDDMWIEEMETLEAIYGSRYTRLNLHVCSIKLDMPTYPDCTVQFQKSRGYPMNPPVISMIGKLPAYIRLSIYRQAIKHASEVLLGEPMLFSLVDWLETEISRIVNNPGKLKDVTKLDVRPTELRIVKDHDISAKFHRSAGLSNPENLSMFNAWKMRQESPRYQKVLSGRHRLPAWGLRESIVNTVEKHQVTVISGETGSGKSTQAVQFILDDMIERMQGSAVNIICTQPRRISALGLADRVSYERCSQVGSEVGYIIRGESRHREGITKLSFVTIGVLLRRLQGSGNNIDGIGAALAGVSHVVVDEVHERSLDTDFLLVLLRDILATRKGPKVILMSATLDASAFEAFFKDFRVGKIEIQGRTFPVDDRYLDDIVRMTSYGGSNENTHVNSVIQKMGMGINYDIIRQLVVSIDSQLGKDKGGILIFLPGIAEINRTLSCLQDVPNIHALPLHASLTPSEQRRVFPLAPVGRRKVIASTNVAETSITIEDIVAVIDSGRVKETSFEGSIVKLQEVWASRAACSQRRGRAGRVSSGSCYKLFTRAAESKMMDRPQPEITRVPLENLCLSVRSMGIVDISSFLAKAPTPPDVDTANAALILLERMGAIDGPKLTALGRHMAMIPSDLRCAKLMVYGVLFGALEDTVSIAAILSARSPFTSRQTDREECRSARAAFSKHGDLLSDLQAYKQWAEKVDVMSRSSVRTWCDEHFLSEQVLKDISSNRSQYISSLEECGIIRPGYSSSDHPRNLNANGSNFALLRALVSAALYPQVARISFPDQKYISTLSGAIATDPEARTIKYFAQDSGHVGRVFLHPGSTLFDAQNLGQDSRYMSYFAKIETSKLFIRDLTLSNVYTMLMFGGPIELDTKGRGVVIDGWLRVRGWPRIGVLASRLRDLLDQVLADKIENPATESEGHEVIEMVRKLVELDGMDF